MLASEQPNQDREQPEAREHGSRPLEDRLLARRAEVERLRLFAAWLLLPARLLGCRCARGGLRGAASVDYGPPDSPSGHDAGVLAAYHPTCGTADGHGGRGLLRRGAVASLLRGLGRYRGGPFPGIARDLPLQAVGELAEHLGSHVLGDAAPELGCAACQLHVGLDPDLCLVALLLEGRDDGRRGRALPAGVPSRSLEDGPVVLLVGLLYLDST